jgi:hypothetical protein
MEIAKTIIEQLGGTGRLSVMIGANAFVADTNNVMFGFKGCRKFNKIRITLNGLDLYDVELMKYSPSKLEITKTETVENVYADQMKELIEDRTGLFLSF